MKIKLKKLLINIAICIVAAVVSWFISGEILNLIESRLDKIESIQDPELEDGAETLEASDNKYEGMSDEEKESAEYEDILSQLENGSYHSDEAQDREKAEALEEQGIEVSGNGVEVSGFSNENQSNSDSDEDTEAKLTKLANRIALTLAILGTLMVVYGYANGLMIAAFGELLITIVSIEFFFTLSELTLQETLIINSPLMIVTVIMLIRAIRKYVRQGLEKTIKNDNKGTKIVIAVAAVIIIGAIVIINKKLDISEANGVENLIEAIFIIAMTIMIVTRRDSFYLMLLLYFGVKAIKIGLTFANIGSLTEADVNIALMVYDVMVILITMYGYYTAERKLKEAKEKEMETYINIKERTREEVEERMRLGV